MKAVVLGVLSLFGFASWAAAQTAVTYQKPPAAIEELLDAPLTPVVKPSPDRSQLIVQQLQSFPTIAEVAQPRLRLAGRRELASPSVLDPRCPPGAGVHRWNETTVLSSHFVHGEVTPLLVTRKRTEWYISSLSSPQTSESGRALAADSYTVVVLVKGMV